MFASTIAGFCVKLFTGFGLGAETGKRIAESFMLLSVSAFLMTTVDAGTRLARFSWQELVAAFRGGEEEDKPATGAALTVGRSPRDRRAAATATTRELTCDWTLSFESDPLHRGPAKPLATSALSDLSKSADPAVKYYSGTVTYRTKFNAAKPAPGERVVLSFGSVREIARVKVNGRDVGGLWTAPYEVPVTDALKQGENELEVEVCTSWVNRLVGDASLPAGKRPTWISTGGYKPNSPLRPAGLVGPVRLVTSVR